MNYVFSIGGITIAVRSEGPTWTLDEPLSRFVVDSSVTSDLALVIERGPAPRPRDPALLFDSHAVWRLFRDDGAFRIDCTSEAFGPEPYKTAILDDAFASGTVFMNDLTLNPLDYPLDEVLVANLLGRGRGVELHGCGIVDHDGRGHLFVGVSGAGKTTTARLWGDRAAAIVSDDRVIVRENGGVLWMYGTPWHGEAELSLPLGVPLRGVYLLAQSTTNEIVALPPAEAVARLFRCSFPLFYDSRSLEFTLGFLQRVVTGVPVRELQFRKDAAVVDLVLRAG